MDKPADVEKLPKTYSAANRTKTKALKQQIQDDIKEPPQVS